MPAPANLLKLAKIAANDHSLPPELVCAICDHESAGWQIFAVRYEPEFFLKYVAGLHGISPTERFMRSCSFGLMQIMGQTARELDFKGEFLTQLCDPVTGLEFGCRKLAKCFENHPNDTHAALLAYNGGSDASYPDKVMTLISKYSPTS
jgi:transglycosylase-like protein with SLT domain